MYAPGDPTLRSGRLFTDLKKTVNWWWCQANDYQFCKAVPRGPTCSGTLYARTFPSTNDMPIVTANRQRSSIVENIDRDLGIGWRCTECLSRARSPGSRDDPLPPDGNDPRTTSYEIRGLQCRNTSHPSLRHCTDPGTPSCFDRYQSGLLISLMGIDSSRRTVCGPAV